jgi:hypothetical protein
VLRGFFPVVARTTRPPTMNATRAVRNGVTMPLARW